MKIFISADIEGVSGITSWEATRYGGKGYEAACRQMSLETAAACRGALSCGYEVVVKDGHEDAMNIDHTLLPKEAQLIWVGRVRRCLCLAAWMIRLTE